MNMHLGTSMIVAWIAIGMAASIAGWILPFRRGVTGLLVTAAACLLGSVLFGLAGALWLPDRPESPAVDLIFSAGGALFFLIAVHLGWELYATALHRRATR
jgi:hypothetical protein